LTSLTKNPEISLVLKEQFLLNIKYKNQKKWRRFSSMFSRSWGHCRTAVT